jgi:hypothetical protein
MKITVDVPDALPEKDCVKEYSDPAYLRSVINNEGIGYAVTSYLNGRKINHPTIGPKWRLAKAALEDLERTIKEEIEKA